MNWKVEKENQLHSLQEEKSGMNLDQTLIREIFRKEVLSLTQNKSFMGIWQMFALSSVLKAPIKSVYPNKGNPNVRMDLHRLILPRGDPKFQPVHILWTNTREDISCEHWTPNHFVPLLPFEYRQNPTVDETSKQDDTNTDENNKSPDHRQNVVNKTEGDSTKKDETNVKTNTEQTKTANQAENGKRHNKEGDNNVNIVKMSTCTDKKEMNTTNTTENKIEKRDTGKDKHKYFVPDINNCLNRYVIVSFGGRPYPGLVQDVEEGELEVFCMHKMGRKMSSNCCFWPQRIKDISWYHYSDMMTVIPEPISLQNARHFAINEELFQCALSNCK